MSGDTHIEHGSPPCSKENVFLHGRRLYHLFSWFCKTMEIANMGKMVENKIKKLIIDTYSLLIQNIIKE